MNAESNRKLLKVSDQKRIGSILTFFSFFALIVGTFCKGKKNYEKSQTFKWKVTKWLHFSTNHV